MEVELTFISFGAVYSLEGCNVKNIYIKNRVLQLLAAITLIPCAILVWTFIGGIVTVIEGVITQLNKVVNVMRKLRK